MGPRSALLPATAASKRLGYFRLGSKQSRAAARALVIARQDSEEADDWDKPFDCTGLAERLRAARERIESGEAPEPWSSIYIPPGKQNTVRGRLAARLNSAMARVRQGETR